MKTLSDCSISEFSNTHIIKILKWSTRNHFNFLLSSKKFKMLKVKTAKLGFCAKKRSLLKAFSAENN